MRYKIPGGAESLRRVPYLSCGKHTHTLTLPKNHLTGLNLSEELIVAV